MAGAYGWKPHRYLCADCLEKCGSLEVSQSYGSPWPVTGLVFYPIMPYHSSGDHSQASNCGGPGSIPAQFMRDLWWTKWLWVLGPYQVPFRRWLHIHLSSGATITVPLVTGAPSRLSCTQSHGLGKKHKAEALLWNWIIAYSILSWASWIQSTL
jgi:hypothetical protein